MIKGPLLAYAMKNKYALKNGFAAKLINGYYVTLSEEYGYKRINIAVTKNVDNITLKDLDKFVTDNIERYMITKYRWHDTNIEICFQSKNGAETVKKMDFFLNDLLTRLNNSNIGGSDVCFYCKRRNNELSHVYYLDGVVLKAHENCIRSYDEEYGITKNKNYSNGKTFSGFIGACYGAFIGTIALFISTILEFPLAFLALLTGMFSRFYYDVCDGKKSLIYKVVITIVVSLAMITLNFVLAGFITGNKFNNYETFKNVRTAYIFSMIFGLIGGLINIKSFRKDKYPKDRLYCLKK